MNSQRGKQVSAAYLPLFCTKGFRFRFPVPALMCTWFPVETCFRRFFLQASWFSASIQNWTKNDLKSDQRVLLEISSQHWVRLPSLNMALFLQSRQEKPSLIWQRLFIPYTPIAYSIHITVYFIHITHLNYLKRSSRLISTNFCLKWYCTYLT